MTNERKDLEFPVLAVRTAHADHFNGKPTFRPSETVSVNTSAFDRHRGSGCPLTPATPDQVSGGPDWTKSEVFDIEATVDDSLVEGDWKKLSYDERRKQAILMLRSLLLDRFKLRVRHETRVLPVYVLLVAEGGPKFSEDDSQSKNWRVEGLGGLGGKAISAPLVGWLPGMISGLLGDRVVLDKTGLQGHYSFTFLIPAADQSAGSASSSDSSASLSLLSAALENQLGLRLESTTAPVDTIVIEHIEHPTEN